MWTQSLLLFWYCPALYLLFLFLSFAVVGSSAGGGAAARASAAAADPECVLVAVPLCVWS